ncbi:hypothetical protein [Paracraurococcus ruber]|uniref:Uncharacterized protein n=1 Tax=Paracraurococcus ruber TaxID=77675 RepID=A0ABS1CQR3_9PROT|nr:hypothetical protein [Paracraurococcus ruber]MBK1656690.1 hypothetical protein [Paracraurococcus ruber]TDG33692.1 hypothetical protein E2C05_02400 [Paracraurococcus ruber]
MILERHGNGEASLVQDGREVLRISAPAAEDPVYDALLDGIEATLCGEGPPRLVVTYREGLFAGAVCEVPLSLVLVEEDPHDDPPRQIRRQRLEAEPARLPPLLAGLADGTDAGGTMRR